MLGTQIGIHASNTWHSQGSSLRVEASIQTTLHIQTMLLLQPVQSRHLLYGHFDFSFDECLVIWSEHNSLRGYLKPRIDIGTADWLKYLEGAMEGEVGLFDQVAKPVAGGNICPKKSETVYPQIWVF